MNWMNDEAENKKLYEQSLHPDGIKKTIKLSDITGKKLDVVSTIFSVNKEKSSNEMNTNMITKIANIIAMIIIVIVFLVIFLV